MSDWLYLLGGGIALLWVGAWLLLHLGNFEQRIAQMRMTLETRMGGIERQFASYTRAATESERTAQLAHVEIGDLKKQLDDMKLQLDETKRAINVLEIAVNDLKLRANTRGNLRVI